MTKILKLSLVVLIALAVTGCIPEPFVVDESFSSTSPPSSNAPVSFSTAQGIINNKCMACHSPGGSASYKQNAKV